MTGYASEPLPLRKVHSQGHADAYVAAGWSLRSQFFAEAPLDSEPYEYVFVWEADGQPIEPLFPKN